MAEVEEHVVASCERQVQAYSHSSWRAVGESVTEKGRLPRTLTVETDVEPAYKLWIGQPIA